MRAWNGHFDGKVIVLDKPVASKPDAKVKVITAEEAEDLAGDFTRLSEAAFERIWDNPLDAGYEKL